MQKKRMMIIAMIAMMVTVNIMIKITQIEIHTAATRGK